MYIYCPIFDKSKDCNSVNFKFSLLRLKWKSNKHENTLSCAISNLEGGKKTDVPSKSSLLICPIDVALADIKFFHVCI